MPKTPVFFQAEAHECGLACLAMVWASYGRGASLTALRQRFAIGQQGLALKDLVGAATQMGFAQRALRGEPGDLAQLKLPAILHWNLNHFVVLTRVSARGCVLHDPAQGRRHVGWNEMGRHFSGVVLELWPGPDFESVPDAHNRLRLRDVKSGFRGHGGSLIWIVVLSALLQIVILVSPWQVQWVVDEALVSADTHLLIVLAIGFLLLAVVRVATHWLRGSLVVTVGHATAFQLGSGLLARLLHLPVDWFAKRHAGDVLSRFASLGPVRDLVTQGLAGLVVDFFMVLLSLCAMAVYAFELALTVVAINGLFVAIYLAILPRLTRATMSTVVAQASEQAHLLETTRAIQSVKVYGQSEQRLSQWQELNADALAHSLAAERMRLGAGSVGVLCGSVELTLIVYLGAHSVLDQLMTLGMLYAFLSYRGHFSERLRSAVDALVQVRTLRVHLDRLADIWCAQPEGTAGASGLHPRSTDRPASIVVSGISYRFADNLPWVFQGVDGRIDAGEFVAVVGASGVGKSTLLRLMMGLAEPTSGSITVNGIPMSPATRSLLNDRVACVLQEDSLFAGSVAHNVTLFHPPDLERLHEVMAAVGLAAHFARLPMGYATPVGEIASGFSSGQVQRLMLARALYQKPRLLFLDEGTANLDDASAGLIRELVSELECTRVVVCHDLEFARAADRVYQLHSTGLVAIDPRISAARS